MSNRGYWAIISAGKVDVNLRRSNGGTSKHSINGSIGKYVENETQLIFPILCIRKAVQARVSAHITESSLKRSSRRSELPRARKRAAPNWEPGKYAVEGEFLM